MLSEQLSWYQPVGALVVLAGVAVSQGLFTRRGAPAGVLHGLGGMLTLAGHRGTPGTRAALTSP